jgi:hypothetical protein
MLAEGRACHERQVETLPQQGAHGRLAFGAGPDLADLGDVGGDGLDELGGFGGFHGGRRRHREQGGHRADDQHRTEISGHRFS